MKKRFGPAVAECRKGWESIALAAETRVESGHALSARSVEVEHERLLGMLPDVFVHQEEHGLAVGARLIAAGGPEPYAAMVAQKYRTG